MNKIYDESSKCKSRQALAKSSIGFHFLWNRGGGRPTNDPQHWRERVAKMRELARTMADPNAAILMIDLAAEYDKLAERADIRIDGGKPPRSNGKQR